MLVAVIASIVQTEHPAYAAVVDDVRADADWIMSARLPDGAIANYVDKQAIWPYLSNFAAMGLARATEVTKNTKYVQAAWAWASWYRAHMDTQGFVTDYTVQNGTPVSTGFMDSTDSYAATFLMAVRDIYRVNRDLTKLKALRSGIAAAVGAIEATQDVDGLTWAKPAWRVKYLMDQSEVYAGLLAGADLAGTLGDKTLRTRATNDASRVRNGVTALWNTSTAAYDWAVHPDGARVKTTWPYLYSDALQQAWAVAFGLVPDVRAKSLMSRFVAEQPGWAMPNAMATYSGGTAQEVGYWPVAGLALQRVGDLSAPSGLTKIRSAAVANGRAWPYTTAIAGQLILLEAIGLSGARTFDALSISTVRTLASSPSKTSTSFVPAPSTNTTTAPAPKAAPTATPQPSPSPMVSISEKVGPVGAEVGVDPSGVSVSATASPIGGPGP